MNIIDEIGKRKVLILGFGREGVSSYKFLRKKFPHKHLWIADKKELYDLSLESQDLIKADTNVTSFLGKNYLNNINTFDIVIKTPGISYMLNEIISAKRKGVNFISQTSIFLEYYKDRIIGVTGTKGKSTTASLIYHILKENNVPSVLLGNIGKPPLDYLNRIGQKTIVFEMSSHQLMDINKSPHVAVFLNIFLEHLDYYGNFDDYLNAKENISRFQEASDFFIYNADFDEIKGIARATKAQKLKFSKNHKVDYGCFVENGSINFVEKGSSIYEAPPSLSSGYLLPSLRRERNPSEAKNSSLSFLRLRSGFFAKGDKFSTKNIPLLGQHNLYNVMAAIVVSKLSGIENKGIEEAIKCFKPLDGRLESVGNFNSVTFINDTLATIPQATIAAVDSFGGKKMTLILGGYDRGLSFDNFGKDLSKKSNVLNVILIGQTSQKIKRSLEEFDYNGEIYDLGQTDMKNVVKLASEITPRAGVVLLSPASTSFDMFKDYKDRGDQFEQAVRNLNEKNK